MTSGTSAHLYTARLSGASPALSVLPAVTKLQYRAVFTMNFWRTIGTCAQARNLPALSFEPFSLFIALATRNAQHLSVECESETSQQTHLYPWPCFREESSHVSMVP